MKLYISVDRFLVGSTKEVIQDVSKYFKEHGNGCVKKILNKCLICSVNPDDCHEVLPGLKVASPTCTWWPDSLLEISRKLIKHNTADIHSDALFG